eukprot:TRINITY_DN910_c0_g1_i1.p1 TRINITY_DN910_c0_g1~~TRINITY_DN910_c0_g1_i1.p1  ORF type:complete len:596 (-),score=211.50 TRINITY_DN910_c0_g1_i1:140-1927(-)
MAAEQLLKQVFDLLKSADNAQITSLLSSKNSSFDDFRAALTSASVKKLDPANFPQDLRKRVEQILSQKNSLTAEEKQLKEAIKRLTEEVSQAEESNSSLKRSLADESSSREANERKLRREREELERTNRRLDEAKKEKKALQDKLEQIKSDSKSNKASAVVEEKDDDDGSYEVIPWSDINIISSYGRSDSGEVHVAQRTGEKMFIKKLTSKRVFDEHVQLVGLLHSGYVLKMFGASSKPTNRFIALEYLPRNLNDIILDKSVELSWEKKWNIAKDVLLGLNYLHSRTPSVIKSKEQGLRPYNAFIGSDWTTKLSLAGVIPYKNIQDVDDDVYLPPEANSESFSEKWDVYALGMIMWQLASRKKPFEGLSKSKISQIINDETELTNALGLDDSIPADFRKIVESCLISKRRPTLTRLVKQFKDKGLLANRVEYLKSAANKIEDIEREVSIQVELVEKAERQAAQAERRYQREKQITEDTIKQREDAERRLDDQRKKLADLEKKMEDLQSNAERIKREAEEEEKKRKKGSKKEEGKRQREFEEIQEDIQTAERKLETAKRTNEQLRRNLEDLESQIESERSKRTDAERRRDEILRRS